MTSAISTTDCGRLAGSSERHASTVTTSVRGAPASVRSNRRRPRCRARDHPVEDRAHGPHVRADVDGAPRALLRGDEDTDGGGGTERERGAVVLAEREEVDPLPGNTRPVRADPVHPEVAVHDAVHVGVGELIADVERDVDRVRHGERAVIAQDGGQRPLLRSELSVRTLTRGGRREHHAAGQA